jgi:hypothetical protein
MLRRELLTDLGDRLAVLPDDQSGFGELYDRLGLLLGQVVYNGKQSPEFVAVVEHLTGLVGAEAERRQGEIVAVDEWGDRLDALLGEWTDTDVDYVLLMQLVGDAAIGVDPPVAAVLGTLVALLAERQRSARRNERRMRAMLLAESVELHDPWNDPS